MKSTEIRERFIRYFEQHGHERIASSSLVPAGDPTLLFTNAGMVQFKDNFLGLKTPKNRRATSSQKCVRAGGKHNDLENVGFTVRHHTFFEMLGNFSFGDYFKKEAIAYGWELLTKDYQLPIDRLRITVFEKDAEAFDLWKDQGVKESFIYRLGEKDNFWAMGETGPCGPCSEIHWDWGKDTGCKQADCNPGCDCGRFLELWNLVFMQFNRDASGKMEPLPKPSVDTGAGLERLACVLQGVFSNYDTDLFVPLIEAIAKVTKVPVGQDEATDTSMRVIADHLRSCSFLIADGVTPSNEGRGYVLRRILRRAIRHGKKLNQNSPFIYKLVDTLKESLGSVYPELVQQQKLVEELIREEETRFHETLHRGMGILEEAIEKCQKEKQTVLPGKVAFTLYDTFGFPLDLTATICSESKLTIDEAGFDKLMEKQRSQSTFGGKTDTALIDGLNKALKKVRTHTDFLGYETLESSSKLVLLTTLLGDPVDRLVAPDSGFAVFEKTPFYAESGGQAGDTGKIAGQGTGAQVTETLKIASSFIHAVEVTDGSLSVGTTYDLAVDKPSRFATMKNHTATHLLHAALRNTLGNRVKQAGSLVDPKHLRFDFTFPRGLTPEELEQIESSVNQEIAKGAAVSKVEMAYNDAIQSGAIAFFEEKYGDKVRVVRVGSQEKPNSVELCGGTHLDQIADIGFLKVTRESSIASGTRRIEALTSQNAIQYLVDRSQILEDIEQLLGISGENMLDKLKSVTYENKKLKQENEKLQFRAAQAGSKSSGEALWDKKIIINDIQLVMESVPSVNPKVLRSLVDQVRDKLKEKTIVVLASVNHDKAFLCMGLTKDLVGTHDAGVLIKPLAKVLGGTGGGRADFAQAGGTNLDQIPTAFKLFEDWVRANT